MSVPEALPRTASILVVDEQAALGDTLKRFFGKRGYRVEAVSTATLAIELLERKHFDLIIEECRCNAASNPQEPTSFAAPPKSCGSCKGIQNKGAVRVLKYAKLNGRDEDVIVTTYAQSIEKCVEVMRHGAINYIRKPFQLNEIGRSVDQALQARAERTRHSDSGVRANSNGHAPGKKFNSVLSAPIASHVNLIGNSPVMRDLSAMIDRISGTNCSVLLTGGTGTGKELIARAIHERSCRTTGPFVDINCSAIPDTLIEAELFGHQRGTFTGAHETRRGLFEEASGGTLFLDEIDALNLPAQAKLLRVLQERQIRRVGGRENIPIDVRIISATNRNIHAAVSEGSFRNDLFFRLSVIPLHAPPLRERGDDIKLLMNYFLRRAKEINGSELPGSFSDEAVHLLMSYDWPGNVRQLENVVEYAVTMASGEEIEPEDLPGEILSAASSDKKLWPQSTEANQPLAEVERLHILSTYKRCGGHQIKTAMKLGIDRRTLYRKLQQYGVISRSRENDYEALSA